METPLPLTTAVRVLQAQGYTHVLTFGGPVQLDEWTPYGIGGVNGGKRGDYRCTRDGDFIVDYPRDGKLAPGFYLGRWPLLRGTEQGATL